MQKIRVGVLMGGKSTEKEISFNSGRTVCDHLDVMRYTIIPIFQTADGTLFLLPWHFLHRGKISDFEHRLSHEARRIVWDDLKQLVDFIFIAMHGQYAEDGTLQGFLEILQIPYLGSKVFSSALSMDKIMHKKILQTHGIKVPQGITVMPSQLTKENIASIIDMLHQRQIALPYIVKPSREGSSIGVSVVQHEDELESAMLHACYIAGKPQAIIVEEKIRGMEFACITITDYHTGELISLPPTEIVPEDGAHFFCYEQKYMPGRAHKHTPARCCPNLSQKIQSTCREVMQILNITNISRIDGFVTNDGEICIIDPNSLSGMDPASFIFRTAAEHNMNHTQLINHLIETELHAYGMLEPLLKREKEESGMQEKKMRITVLLGGSSNEKEISLASGRNVIYKLSPQQYEVTAMFVSSTNELYPIGPRLLIRNTTKEIEELIDPMAKIKWADLVHKADFVFIALHGGIGENGCVQGTLEMLGIPYNGSSVLTSALCMDKYKTNNYLRSCGFDIPNNMLIHKADFIRHPQGVVNRIINTIPFPIIIKPHDDGCSVLVQQASTPEEIHEALQHLFTQEKVCALIEECIQGMELTVCCIGNDTPRALPPSQAIAQKSILSIQEKFLPGAGENQTPAPLPKEALTFVQKTIEQIYQTLNCKGYCRIDCFYQDAQQSPTKQERLIFIEANTLPGLTPATCIFHQAAEIGLKPSEFIQTILDYGLEEHTGHLTHARACAQKDLAHEYQ